MADSTMRTVLEGDAAKLFQEFTKIINKSKEMEGSYKKVTGETKKQTQEQRKLESAAKRVFDSTRTPMERHTRKMRELNDLVKRGKIDQDTYGRAVRQSREQMDRAGRSGREAFGARALSQVKSMVAGFFGISAAVAGINKGYDVWLKNIRDVAQAAEKATGDYIAFAALQEGGKKAERVMKAASLGAEYGIGMGEAYTTVQAMQSRTGDFASGLKASETVFASTLGGMKIGEAREVAVLAGGQGRDPATALRRAEIAGQASLRSPKELASAGPGLKYWKDRELGWAAASVLAGAGRAQELRTYLKQGGMALSEAPGPVQKKFEGMGLGKAGQMKRLEALADLGVTTPAAAAQFGFSEIRAREAVSDLVSRIDKLRATHKTIQEKAKPGLFVSQRLDIEKELPGAKHERFGKILTAEYGKQMALGPDAERAQKLVNEQRARALAFRRLGYTQAGPFALMEDVGEGDWRSTQWDVTEAQIFGLHRGVVKHERKWIQRHLEAGLPIPEKTFAEQPRSVQDELWGERGTAKWIEVIEKLDRVADRMEAATRARPVKVNENR